MSWSDTWPFQVSLIVLCTFVGGDQSEWNTFIFQIFNIVAAIETLTHHWFDMIQYTKERPGTFQIPSNWFFWVQDVNP